MGGSSLCSYHKKMSFISAENVPRGVFQKSF